MSKKPEHPLEKELVENYRGRIQNEILMRGVPGFLDWLTDEYQQHIDIVKAQQERIDQLESVLAETRPQIATVLVDSDESMIVSAEQENAKPVQWSEAVWVEVRVWIRHGAKAEDLDVGVFPPHLYYKDKHHARRELLSGIIALIGHEPLEVDISGGIEGLTNADIITACKELAPYIYIESLSESYTHVRLELFERYWPQINEALKSEERNYEKRRADCKKHFFRVIERTLENSKRRIPAYKMDES